MRVPQSGKKPHQAARCGIEGGASSCRLRALAHTWSVSREALLVSVAGEGK
jgi:hypothetical protein